MDNYLTVAEFAEKCGVSSATIYNRIKAGEIKPVIKALSIFIDINETPIYGRKNPGRKKARP